ncbi:hypothetical protein AB0K12_32890 [Nonomuraea sp. NPDC049419]|uniref:hypothetical protein n=1 Tax=Nonomuraea sp. NPDC049419 TaxID=3155772 RepID=UPI003418764E
MSIAMSGDFRRTLAVLLLAAGAVLVALAFVNPTMVIVTGSLAAVAAAIVAIYRALWEGDDDNKA